MEFINIIKKARAIRQKYSALEIQRYGKEWTKEQLMQGFVHDVEELKDLITTNGQNEKIAHELSDCLWSIIILADKFGIDLQKAFLKTMDEIDAKIDSKTTKYLTISKTM